MNVSITSLPPWHEETKLFEHPAASCELVLDGKNRTVSLAIWENYCYLKLAELHGLWAIARPYDGTEITKFVTQNIEQDEVGRVWYYHQGFANFDYCTGKPLLDIQGPLVADSPLLLIAIVRQNNSALVREAENCPFFETSVPAIKKKRITKAHIPSIWSPARQLVERRQIARLASPLAHRFLLRNELIRWKTGSLPEAVMLLETFCFYSSLKGAHYYSYHGAELLHYRWPFKHEDIHFPRYAIQPKVEVMPFIRAIWVHNHFDKNDWLPARGAHYLSVGSKRYEWCKANDNQVLAVRREPFLSAHEKLEATLKMLDFFKGKVNDDEWNELNKLIEDNL